MGVMTNTRISTVLLGCLLLHMIGMSDGVAWVHVKFVSYHNPGGQSSHGRPCDVSDSLRVLDGCDHKFEVCIDQLDSSGAPRAARPCFYARSQTSRVFENRDNINFDPDPGNSFRFRLDRWPGVVRLKIKVQDQDGDASQDRYEHVDNLSRDLTLTPTTSGSIRNYTMRLRGKYQTELVVEVSVYCGQDYYGLDCGTLCSPQTGDHYRCTAYGNKVCHPGWTGDQCNININDCINIYCRNGGSCQDLSNGFMCACVQGYHGKYCEEDKNECQAREMCGMGTCVNTPGSYTCRCFPGYSGKKCEIFTDICESKPCRNGGTCENVQGDFRCHCTENYKGATCVEDVDECLERHPCHDGSTCFNTHGSFTCQCPDGLEGRTCSRDIDECRVDLCAHGATCVNMYRSFHCQCAPGYKGRLCIGDVDECEDSQPCQNDGTCINVIGSFSCACVSGYHGRLCDQDVDECEDLPCHNSAVCENSVGSFSCRCGFGYKGRLCEDDINECQANVCKNGGVCTNLDGSFKCACSRFWEGITCEENIDECQASPCRNGATCHDQLEGFTCQCEPGWVRHTCALDLDECAMAEACNNGATCHNTPGSYRCDCPEGWRGQVCDQDIDECSEFNSCHNNGACVNTRGGYSCLCPHNWTGTRCETDVDECLAVTDICGRNGSCVNLPGDFQCLCEPGFTGSLCDQDVDECSTSQGLCTHAGNFPSFTSDDSLPLHGFNNSSASYVWDSSNNDRTQVKRTAEYSSFTSLPSRWATNSSYHFVCVNTRPGYSCLCQVGWTGRRCRERTAEKDDSFIRSTSKHFAIKPFTSQTHTDSFGRRFGENSQSTGSIYSTQRTGEGFTETVTTTSSKVNISNRNNHRGSNLSTNVERIENGTANKSSNNILDEDKVLSTHSGSYLGFSRQTVGSTPESSKRRRKEMASVAVYPSTTVGDESTMEEEKGSGADTISRETLYNSSTSSSSSSSSISQNTDKNYSGGNIESGQNSLTRTGYYKPTEGGHITSTAQIPPETTSLVSEDKFPEVTVPFYLTGQISQRNYWIVDSGLSRLLEESRLFQGKQLHVTSVFSLATASNGEQITKVYPVVRVGGRTLSDREVASLLGRLSYKFSNFIHYPLYTGEIGVDFSATSVHDRTSQGWYPAPIIAGLLLLLVLVVAVLLRVLKYRRSKSNQTEGLGDAKEGSTTAHHINGAFVDDEGRAKEEGEQGERERRVILQTEQCLASMEGRSVINPISRTNPMYGTRAIPTAPAEELGKVPHEEDTSSSCSGDGQPDGQPNGQPCEIGGSGSLTHERIQQADVTVHLDWSGDVSVHPVPDATDNTHHLPSSKMLVRGYQYKHNANSDQARGNLLLDGQGDKNLTGCIHRYDTVDCSAFHAQGSGGTGSLIQNLSTDCSTNDPESRMTGRRQTGETRAGMDNAVAVNLVRQEASEATGGPDQGRVRPNRPALPQNLVVRQKVVQMEPVVNRVPRQESRSLDVRQQTTHRQASTFHEVAIKRSSAPPPPPPPTVSTLDRRWMGAEQAECERFKNLMYIDEPAVATRTGHTRTSPVTAAFTRVNGEHKV